MTVGEMPSAPEGEAPGGFIVPDQDVASAGDGTRASAGDDTRPEQGSLNLAGRRAWKTWQLTVAVLVAALFGMWFNGTEGSASSTAGIGGSSSYKLPAPGASTGGGSSSGVTTTTVAGGATTTTSPEARATTTTAPGDTTTTTAAATVGPATVLVPSTQLTGNWTSPTFNIAGGTWNIGWAYACAPVPATTPTFAVFVVNAGASTGTTPVVSSSTPSGQSVTPQTSAGSQQIVVRAPAGCRWAVKVTGSSS
jgi:hypothetical protein